MQTRDYPDSSMPWEVIPELQILGAECAFEHTICAGPVEDFGTEAFVMKRKTGESLLRSSGGSWCWRAVAESLGIRALIKSHCCKVVVAKCVSAFCIRGRNVDILGSVGIFGWCNA